MSIILSTNVIKLINSAYYLKHRKPIKLIHNLTIATIEIRLRAIIISFENPLDSKKVLDALVYLFADPTSLVSIIGDKNNIFIIVNHKITRLLKVMDGIDTLMEPDELLLFLKLN